MIYGAIRKLEPFEPLMSHTEFGVAESAASRTRTHKANVFTEVQAGVASAACARCDFDGGQTITCAISTARITLQCLNSIVKAQEIMRMCSDTLQSQQLMCSTHVQYSRPLRLTAEQYHAAGYGLKHLKICTIALTRRSEALYFFTV